MEQFEKYLRGKNCESGISRLLARHKLTSQEQKEILHQTLGARKKKILSVILDHYGPDDLEFRGVLQGVVEVVRNNPSSCLSKNGPHFELALHRYVPLTFKLFDDLQIVFRSSYFSQATNRIWLDSLDTKKGTQITDDDDVQIIALMWTRMFGFYRRWKIRHLDHEYHELMPLFPTDLSNVIQSFLSHEDYALAFPPVELKLRENRLTCLTDHAQAVFFIELFFDAVANRDGEVFASWLAKDWILQQDLPRKQIFAGLRSHFCCEYLKHKWYRRCDSFTEKDDWHSFIFSYKEFTKLSCVVVPKTEPEF